ncbi:uncharacterized protein LOC111702174 isoform X2 [Eurytemora carolleeae]|nr:uncharacterized protein LOC111702174 isoform X2 [Eurytemora carolleeae]XP_023329539.1 uncharacterized protein LOC111702174 isoform X2 [Eurytemora carolleeae]XP_023329540.1 uncharacterized protein LOC111702174 isoform X2 [Eurytemora carolleeae]XP_023329541.1 uncharacterized protein LOC111702174 isoform X2 [Eurytemora carolleeae]XP_023329542.1 uncharacterized protein LOC111702174 isoform X2 [Eurytemora carolleeae]|eukprot:XP_023329538.1 uncharacterized protein LOC111702174 isoform X2 [Eurytemora affinis]
MGKGEAPNSGKEENMEMKVLKKVKKTKAPVSGRSCIMVVGTSGTGKTTLLNLYTGAQELTGSGAQGVTNSTVVVEDTKHSNAPLWMDNPGWSDPGGKSDSHVFKDLLLQMQTLGIYNLKAVIWCVFPQLRMDATLQAQAKFIDEFTVESDAGRIWSNVVVVAKGKAQKTVAEDCQGACTAAKKLWVHAEPVCRGWELATPEIVNETTERLRKETLRCYTEEEILEELETVIKQLPPPVQVVFANQRCQSCGQTGDPRLMEDKCHR